jgi:hypothetical protein
MVELINRSMEMLSQRKFSFGVQHFSHALINGGGADNFPVEYKLVKPIFRKATCSLN